MSYQYPQQQQPPPGYPQQQPQQPAGYPQYPQQPAYPPQPGYPPQQPPYVPQPAPGGYPQQPPPGYPQPNPPGMAPGYPQYPQQPGYPQQPAYPQAPMPQFFLPDNGATAAEYQRSKEEAQRFGQNRDGPQYLKFPGPDGTPKWDTARVGFESVLRVYIAPPWKEGKPIFKKVASHFWRSAVNPQGTSLPCAGEQCLICRARDAILMGTVAADATLMKRAKDYGKVRKQWLYNVFLLDNPQAHMDQKQQMRPLILAAGASLHTVLGDLVDACGGALQLVHPQQGRPIRLRKVKRGPSTMEVDYFAMPLDREPLPPHFYPALGALHDLDTLERVPSQEDQLKALHELGFPGPAQLPPAAAYGGSPAAPAYGAEPYSPGVSSAPPASFGPPGYPPPPPAGYPPPPAGYPQPPQQQPAGYPPPTNLNPPPVYSGMGSQPPAASPYQPQPSQAPQAPAVGGGGAPPAAYPSVPGGTGSPAGAPPPYNPAGAPPGAPGAQQPWPQLDQLRQQLRGATPPGTPGTPGGY